MMDHVKRIDDAKQAQRQNMPAVRQQAPSTLQSQAVRPPPSQIRVPSGVNRTAIQPRPLPKAEFDRQLDRAKGNPALLNEMAEMESLRLQMAMDRMSKTMATLSNLLKKMSDTASGITQNLK